MKFKVEKAISLFMILALIVFSSACTRKIQSADGKYEIQFQRFSGWKEIKGELSENALFEIGNSNESRYMMMISENAEDYSSFEDFSAFFLYFMNSRMEINGKMETEESEINSRSAYVTEFEGEMDGTDVKCMTCLVDYGDEYIEMIAWTQNALFSEDCERDFKDIIQSFRKR